LLSGQLAVKLTKIDWKSVSVSGTKEKLSIFSRIASAYASGKYRAISWKSILIVLAAIIYFLNPIDLIPDLVPVFGFTDDFSILLWVYGTVSAEVDKFLAWEKSSPIVI
jgi:uncharacterized membrane protein YkvA (DUF1232 family)